MAKKLLIVISIILILVFNLSALGDTVSSLLEKGIYAEETKGDLDEAMTIYQKIIDENTGNSANIAEAYYRLGTCCLKTGDEVKAIKMFKKLLTGFRDHVEIASEAKAQLVKLNALDREGQINKPLEFGPVPWESGETSWYNVKYSTGTVAGKMILTVKDITINSNEMWRIEYPTIYPLLETQNFDRVDMLKDNFAPVSSMLKASFAGERGDMRAKYEKGNIQFIADRENKKTKKDIPVEGTVYSGSGQQWLLLRLMPLTENYNTSLKIFMARMGSIYNMQIKTIGMETVKVPAGKFDCYHLELEFNPNLKSQIWVSNDDKKYIVKIEAPGTNMELEKVALVTDDEPQEFDDRKSGISMSVPRGWQFVNSELLTPPFKMQLQLVAPEIKAAPTLLVLPHNNEIKDLHNLVGTTMGALKQNFNNFTIRPESWVDSKIDGMPSLIYIADYDSEDKKMVEYRAYILSPYYLGTFVLRTDKETFNEIKSDYDSIIKSFKWKKRPFSFM